MKKIFIKQVFLIASIMFCMPTLCMMNTLRDYVDRFKNWSYKTFFEKGPVYEKGVQAIDTTASNLSTAAVRLSPITFSRLTPEAKKRHLQLQQGLIDRRLKTIENQLKQEEKNTINDMFNDYDLTKDQRQAIITMIDEEKQFEKEYMSRPHKKTIGNTEVRPEHIYIYKTAGIHPQGVQLIRSDLGNIQQLGRSTGIEVGPSTKPLKTKAVIAPPKIELSTRPDTLQEIATFAHEVGHIASHHGTIGGLLQYKLAAISGTTPEEVSHNKNYQKLVNIFEREAEILHKNSLLANIMRDYRRLDYYTGQFFWGHYQKLAEIDELHKLKEKLENYKPEPMQPKIDTLSTMKFNAPAPLPQLPKHQSPQKPKVVPVRPISADAQQLATE